MFIEYLDFSEACFSIYAKLTILLYLSRQNEKGHQQNNESEKAFVKTEEYDRRQNEDYV